MVEEGQVDIHFAIPVPAPLHPSGSDHHPREEGVSTDFRLRSHHLPQGRQLPATRQASPGRSARERRLDPEGGIGVIATPLLTIDPRASTALDRRTNGPRIGLPAPGGSPAALTAVHREPPQQAEEVAHLIRESERRSGALTPRISTWDTRWADTRIHGTTKRQVAAMFAEERPA